MSRIDEIADQLVRAGRSDLAERLRVVEAAGELILRLQFVANSKTKALQNVGEQHLARMLAANLVPEARRDELMFCIQAVLTKQGSRSAPERLCPKIPFCLTIKTSA